MTRTLFSRLKTGVSWRLKHLLPRAICVLSLLLGLLKGLPGGKFAWFGLRCARRLQKAGMTEAAWLLSVNPVSSIRYFEFPFVERHMPYVHGGRYLDVSSPMLFGCWWLAEHDDVEIDFINPDKNDLQANRLNLQGLGYEGRARFFPQNAGKLHWQDETFDGVWIISVVEHIAEPGDVEALREIQRVLKKGGHLVVTTVVSSKFQEEYRRYNTYGIEQSRPGGQKNYFFQRRYDAEKLQSRVVDSLDRMTLLESEVWTEKEDGLFDNYVQAWMTKGFGATSKDPMLMSRYFEKCEFRDVKGFGVGCYLFEKQF